MRVQGLRSLAKVEEFGFWGLNFGSFGFGFRVLGSGFWVLVFGFRFSVFGSGFWVLSSGLKVLGVTHTWDHDGRILARIHPPPAPACRPGTTGYEPFALDETVTS